jgi:uncharacterized protein (TIGR00296 family)
MNKANQKLTASQGHKLLRLARKAIEGHFGKKPFKYGDEKKEFSKPRGVFVCLCKNKICRGCIGYPYPTKPLADAVVDSAKAAAFTDPRFMPLKKEELSKIKLEISVLTEPKEIIVKGQDILKEIEIGQDGLIIQFSGFSGLLLPQVAVEQKWNVLDFLRATCSKAGLPPETWLNPNCHIYKFQAQIFSEEKIKAHRS